MATAVTEIVVSTHWSWRWHSLCRIVWREAPRSLHGENEHWRRDSLAIGHAENAIQAAAGGSRCLFHHASGETLHRHFRHLQNEFRWSLRAHRTMTETALSEREKTARRWRRQFVMAAIEMDISSGSSGLEAASCRRRGYLFVFFFFFDLVTSAVVRARNLNRCGFSSQTLISSIRVCTTVKMARRTFHFSTQLLFAMLTRRSLLIRLGSQERMMM